MTPEELDAARVKEAIRQCDSPTSVANMAKTAARLAREGWTPPEPVDPDLLAAREWAKTTDMGSPALYDDGSYDTEPEIIGFLAGCTRGREGVRGLVEALEKQVYVMSQSHGDGARLSIGFLTTNEANDAHEAVARLASAKRGG